MMNITECKRCRHHVSEFYGRYKSYPKLYIWIEIDETKNVACPREYDSGNHMEENKLGSEH